MPVHLYLCMHVCNVYGCVIFVSVFVCMHMYAKLFKCVYAFVYVFVCVSVSVCVFV